MLGVSALLALVLGTTAVICKAPPGFTFKGPIVKPFWHIDLGVSSGANTTTELGLVGRSPNVGGKIGTSYIKL
jgi:hypothetical protein